MAYGKARIDQIQSSTKTVNVDDLLTNAAGSITSAMIADGAIVNADINASAAIALSKLATGALPTSITVASANLVDGTIVNADVNVSAAIDGTKISPDFGAQTITTSGNLLLSGTGYVDLPAGTTAQRPGTPNSGMLRYNSDLNRFEGYSSAWGSLGGATGGGSDDVFYENAQSVTASYSITSGKNAMSAGPITIESGATVTIGASQSWSIV